MAADELVVDLNADVGEEPDGLDLAVVPWVTTVHVACGFHAGDPATMRRAVAAAVEAGVAVGAHPSYPDRDHFGRRELDRAPDRVAEDVAYQVGALCGVARAAGAAVTSVKPHGALYHRMAADEACAAAVARAVAAVDPGLALVVPATLDDRSAAGRALAVAGPALRREAFCDRAYLADGSLAPRQEQGALLADAGPAAAQAVAIVCGGQVVATDGTAVALRADTLCVHGDTPGAALVAGAVRRALEQAGVRVAAPGRPRPVG